MFKGLREVRNFEGVVEKTLKELEDKHVITKSMLEELKTERRSLDDEFRKS